VVRIIPQPDLSGALFSSDAFIRRKKAGTEGGIAAQKKKRMHLFTLKEKCRTLLLKYC
jgi:hypothetical protein